MNRASAAHHPVPYPAPRTLGVTRGRTGDADGRHGLALAAGTRASRSPSPALDQRRPAEAGGSASYLTLMADEGPFATGHSRWRRWARWSAPVVLAAAAVFFALPTLAGVPAQLARGSAAWIAAAGALELFSAVGFVLVFKLVFAARDNWRRTIPGALRALGASTIFPGGGVIGPGTGAWSMRPEEKPSLSQLTRSTTTFVILTNAPGVAALAATGVLLALGVSNGPRQPALTILPAIAAAGLLTAMSMAARDRGRQRRRPRHRLIARALATPVVAMSGGTRDAGRCSSLATGSSAARSPTTRSTMPCSGRPSMPSATRLRSASLSWATSSAPSRPHYPSRPGSAPSTPD